MNQPFNTEFGKIRSFFWPVHSHERKRIVPMLLIAFLIAFNYNILRTVKDSLIVTAEGSGAETIPFIKVWVLLPMAILMTYIFSHLAHRLNREQIFYFMISLFLSFFFIFVFFLYPSHETLHPHSTADYLETILPIGFKGLIAIFRNWTFTAYYVMAELWGNIILSLLFWGFANEVSNIKEAKRFYALIGISLNCASIFSGQIALLFSIPAYNSALPFGQDPWEQSLILLISTVIICGFAIMGIFKWMTVNEIYKSTQTQQGKKKLKLSMRKSFSSLRNSRYLLYIALIVLSYNLVINLVEVIWKGELKLLYPNPVDYNIHMSKVSTAMGIVATLLSLFISGQSIRKFGWTFTASITPIILLISSIAFFSFLFLKNYAYDITYSMLGASPLLIVCLLGSAHNTFCRGAKYSVFDATKEMAFIPLSPESKLTGKAAIDGVGSRLGKSGGSLVHQCLLMVFTSLSSSAPYIALLVFSAVAIWIFAIKILGKHFNSLLALEEEKANAEDSSKEKSIKLSNGLLKTMNREKEVI